jgi:hypothetical protein
MVFSIDVAAAKELRRLGINMQRVKTIDGGRVYLSPEAQRLLQKEYNVDSLDRQIEGIDMELNPGIIYRYGNAITEGESLDGLKKAQPYINSCDADSRKAAILSELFSF